MNTTEERLSDALEAFASTVRPETLRPLADPVPGPARRPLADPDDDPAHRPLAGADDGLAQRPLSGPGDGPAGTAALRARRHRAWLAPLAAAAAVVIVAGLALVLTGRAGSGPAAGLPAGLPRYYVILVDNPPNPPRGTPPGESVQVRDTATGQLRDTLPLTLRLHSHMYNGGDALAAAADHHTFFVTYPAAFTSSPSTGTNIYRFHLTGSGHITGFAKVARALTSSSGYYAAMAASPDGRKLAFSGVLPGQPAGRPAITVIDLSTGAWTTETMPQTTTRPLPKGSRIGSLSWAANGHTLAFEAILPNAGTATRQDDYSRDVTEIWTQDVYLAVNSGAWSGSHLVTRQPASPAHLLTSPIISADGRTITAMKMTSRPSAHPSPADQTQNEVVQISTATGRQLRVLYQGAHGGLSGDHDGHWMVSVGQDELGWIDGGQLHLLPTGGAGTPVDFTW